MNLKKKKKKERNEEIRILVRWSSWYLDPCRQRGFVIISFNVVVYIYVYIHIYKTLTEREREKKRVCVEGNFNIAPFKREEIGEDFSVIEGGGNVFDNGVFVLSEWS